MHNKISQVVKKIILLSILIIFSFTSFSLIKEYYQRCEVGEVTEFNRVEILSRRKKATTKEQIGCKRKTTGHPVLDNIKDFFYEKLMWNKKQIGNGSKGTTIITKKVRLVDKILLAGDKNDFTLLEVSFRYDGCGPRNKYVANVQGSNLTIGIIPIRINAQACTEIGLGQKHTLLIPPEYSVSFKELSGDENGFTWIF